MINDVIIGGCQRGLTPTEAKHSAYAKHKAIGGSNILYRLRRQYKTAERTIKVWSSQLFFNFMG